MMKSIEPIELHELVCNIMRQVKDKKEEEFDWILSVARLYDEGFPSLDHVHDETDRSFPCHHYDIVERSGTIPGECATTDAPSVVGTKGIGISS